MSGKPRPSARPRAASSSLAQPWALLCVVQTSREPELTPSPSTIREVPDNQEVYLDKDGFTSIIFDITQRVDAPGDGLERDGRALTIHLEDLVGDDADGVKVWNTTETQFSHLEYASPSPPCYKLKPQPLTPNPPTAKAYPPTPSSRRRLLPPRAEGPTTRRGARRRRISPR